MKEFHINKYLSVRLEKRVTRIYICGQPFIICKFLLLDIPIVDIKSFDRFHSIDEVAEKVDVNIEESIREVDIPPEVEFWGHCSNLQVWYEYGYDTRLIHSNLAFQVLKKLSEVGDPLAKKVFKNEIIKRYENGTDKTREYLRVAGFLRELPLDIRLDLLLDNLNFNAFMELFEQLNFNDPKFKIENLLEMIVINDRKITELHLNDLNLTKFPEVILKLTNLICINLNNNRIKSIPNKFDKLNSLKKLWSEFNLLESIPDSLCELKNLEEIWAGGNKIQSLPLNIGKLKKLRMLRISSNNIRQLPESFCELISLENLALSENQIEMIPESFCNLTSLKWASLSNNNLSSVPECFKNLKSLEYLDLKNNPMVLKE